MGLETILILVAISVILTAAAAVLFYRGNTKRIMQRVRLMLDDAMKGKFTESDFNETMLSAVETKFAHYLSASEVSAKNLSEEKDKIKELIADISHQTKTPMANILMYAQLLKEQELPEQSRFCVTELNSQAEKLNFLISSLVKISRLEAGVFTFSLKKSAIKPMIDSVAEQISPKANEKDIKVSVNAAAEIAVFDAKWTAEAIYNIVDNAVKYTPPRGSIEIKTIAYELFCRIDISDTGMGIPEEEQSRIFGRFYRSPSVSDAEGVGIGLYLARQIIAGQGGYIRVSSSVGNGTVFSVFLPR